MRGLVESSRIRHGRRLALVHWENDTRTEVPESLLVVIAPPPLRYREAAHVLEEPHEEHRALTPGDWAARAVIVGLIVAAIAAVIAGPMLGLIGR
jgi:hypothetical protein